MIINNSSNGPRFSTDATAHDVSRFVSQRRSLPAYTSRDGATDLPGSLEELYPSLYPAPSPNFLAALGRAAAAWIASLFSRRGARHVLPAVALAVVLAARPASAASQVYGVGSGFASDPNTAYSIAYSEADTYIQECPTAVLYETVTSWSDVWNGFQFVATVNLRAICA
jgi:hypothetical protein